MVTAEAKGQDKYQISHFKHANDVFVSEIWQKLKLLKPFQRQECTLLRQSNPLPGALRVGWQAQSEGSVQCHLRAHGCLELPISKRCLLELRDKCFEIGPSERKKKENARLGKRNLRTWSMQVWRRGFNREASCYRVQSVIRSHTQVVSFLQAFYVQMMIHFLNRAVLLSSVSSPLIS